jgi:dTDP-4-dehydrorhamnose 3,5-epimerase
MAQNTIEGVKTKPLKWLRDDRGRLMEMIRCDEEFFGGFGQVYVTVVNPGVVKGWHFHKLQDDSFVPLAGAVRVGLYDAREDSPTKGVVAEYLLQSDNPMALKIPRGVVHGFECMSETEAMVLNLPNVPYNHKQPDELRIHPFENDIPFKWNARRGG